MYKARIFVRLTLGDHSISDRSLILAPYGKVDHKSFLNGLPHATMEMTKSRVDFSTDLNDTEYA
jgi:hypothetical protein